MNQPYDPNGNMFNQAEGNQNQQPNFNQQQQYQQQPQYGMPYADTSVMTVKQWLLTMLIMVVPIVNIVMLFVWAFGSTGNVNRKNWSAAYLIWLAICIGIYILFIIVFGAMFASILSSGAASY